MSALIRGWLEQYWRGEKPKRVPLTIYWWLWKDAQDAPEWEAMYRAGLGVTHHIGATREAWQDVAVENLRVSERETRQILRTPVGELAASWLDGWHAKYYLETPLDYRVMTWIVSHMRIEPALDEYRRAAAALPLHGVPVISIGRTPLQEILVDYAGLENFAIHLYEYPSEVRELYEALLSNFRRRIAIAAGAPGTYVSNLENFTAESLGPERYAEFLLPVYRECFPILHEAGKIVGSHYDGRTRACRDVIAGAPIDMIESLTEPPEGDQTLAECRAAWPDKLFWCNIGVSSYALEADALKAKVATLFRQGSVDGRLMAFEVSEDLPKNWRVSIPIVLEALREL